MLLQFTHAFGNFEPGDEIELLDGATYDSSYLREIAAELPINHGESD